MNRLEEIKAEVASLTNVAKYVEDACPTGAAVIIHARDKLLEMLSKSESVTPEWLEEIKALAQAATPGKWHWSSEDTTILETNATGAFFGRLHVLAIEGADATEADKELLACASEAIPRLIAEAERLTGERDAAVRRAEAIAEKAAATLGAPNNGFCTHYPGYICDRDWPKECPACIKKWLEGGPADEA
ncbi:MAG: hypothetical protein VB099_16420 [Candidatus Limiplasma sp.]|nr:hypothetical protein [Candidatus Limiplasma sp.]